MPPQGITTEPAGPAPDVDQVDDTQATGEPESDTDAGDELPEVTPQPPLDVRLLDALGEFLQARPRWSQPPPSMAEAWEYSTSGDWTAAEKSLKRVLHGLCVLIAFVVTYPIDWAVQAARCKPIGFVLAIAVLFVISKVR